MQSNSVCVPPCHPPICGVHTGVPVVLHLHWTCVLNGVVSLLLSVFHCPCPAGGSYGRSGDTQQWYTSTAKNKCEDILHACTHTLSLILFCVHVSSLIRLASSSGWPQNSYRPHPKTERSISLDLQVPTNLHTYICSTFAILSCITY